MNQATIGLLSVVGVYSRWWWLLGVLALQLAVDMVGAASLAAAAAAWAALALLAAVTGFCTGCYKLGSVLLGSPFVSCPIPPQPARNH